VLLGLTSAARADILTRAWDQAGGGGSLSPTASDDLTAWAGEPKPASLGELLQSAIANAPTLANARLDIAIAEAQIGETLERHAWKVSATANGNRTISAFVGQSVSSSAYGFTGDIGRALPTGGTIDLHVASNYSKYTSAVLGSSELWQDQVVVQLTQPLFKGRGQWLYDAYEHKATLAHDAAALGRRLAAINTVESVIAAYWDLVLAERQVAITEQSLQLARERLRVTQIGAEGGKIAKAEIPAVEQIIATREEDVLNGELNVLNASIALRRAAGMPIGPGNLGLRIATDLDIRDRDTTLSPLVEKTYAASPELAQLAKQDAADTIDIEVNDNGLLPQLDATLSLGPTGQEGSFSGAASDTGQFKNVTVAGQLTFSRSLSQYDVKYKSRELRAVREKVRVNAFDVRAQLAQGISRAAAALELAKRRVVLSSQAIELAKENIRIETDRFNLGTRTNFDVLNRLEDLRQAELRQAQAQIDWHKAENVVQALTGDLLQAYGITVE
jgi:outer membrane protein TolC